MISPNFLTATLALLSLFGFVAGGASLAAEAGSPCIESTSAQPGPRATIPQNTVDNDLATGWSAQEYPPYTNQAKGQWLAYQFNQLAEMDTVRIAWDCPHPVKFDIRASDDGRQWATVYRGTSSDKAGELATYTFKPTTTNNVRITLFGSTRRHWHRLTEVKIGSLPYRPSPEARWATQRWESGPPSEKYLANYRPAPKQSYREMAAKSVATLIERGTDRYGEVHAPIWVLNLDLETMNCFPYYNDRLVERAARSLSYSSTAPYGLGHRAIRGSQREPGCSNLHIDQPMIRAAVLHDLLGGKRTFTPAVEAYTRWYFKHLMNKEKGLLDWGVHTSYNVFTEQLKHADGYQHEVMCILPIWPVFHDVDPKATADYLEKYWYWHTNPKTGQVDRHPTRGRGLDFAAAAGEIVLACAYLHTKEPNGSWLDRALQVARSHWNSRNRETNLFVNTPHGGSGKRFDNSYSDTSISGLWASRVLMAGHITGNQELTDMAHKTLLAWAKYGWDETANEPWTSLRPDGTPNTKIRDYSGNTYDKFDPSGHWDYWKNYVYGFEDPFGTLMTCAVAAQWLDDPQLKSHAVRLAECYRKRLPANGESGTFAANYGQLISFFLAMEELTGDTGYRETAEQVADEAVRHLWTGTMFRGFAGRTHYTAVEGAGYLVQALLELDADPKKLAPLRQENVFLWNL